MRPSMLGAKQHNGPASVKEKLTFEEWYSMWIKTLPSYRGFVNKADMRAAWQAAQGEKP